MAESIGSSASGHPSLNLNAEEKRVYGQLLKDADPDGFGAVSGDVAVKFFERTKLPADVLGQIWQIADTENRGFLTPAGFGVALRLIGHAQAGRAPSAQLAPQSAPLPRFDNAANEQPQPAPLPPQPIPQQSTGTPASPTPAVHPIRVPALGPDKVAEYSSLFEKSGAENGFLSGVIAKQIFERARLPNDVLGRIWALSDTQGRGTLDVTEFVIAMHLLTSYKSGQMRGVPNTLPSGLYEAASRRTPVRMGSGSRPGSSAMQGVPPQIPAFNARPQSPITRQQVSTPLSAQSTGEVWAITPTDKARFDTIFASIDRQGSGYINGEQAVEFFGNARLPEEILAQIWDLADVNSEGRLNKDEFAVAMYLIRQQRATKDGRGNLPQTLPPALIPPSMRKQQAPPPQPTAPSFENAPVTKPRSAADDLFGLDAFGPAPTAPATAPPQVAQSTGGTDAGPFANPPSFAAGLSPQHTSTTFKPFIPSSSFGQSIIPQSTGSPAPQAKSPPMSNDDLLGDADPEVSSKLTSETSELGNLSNQVSTLSKQMTEVQGTRKQTEQELSTTTAQKRAFEGRLAQLRSLYEKEVQEVKVLREQLTANKTEIKRLQQDMAMIDGTHQDLSTQHQQLRAQLESDQRENLALKERIRQTNQEVDQLKPQLDKLKSEARQTKGLVAINKKQLATNETERDRIKAEIAAAQKEVEDAQREAEESARQVEASKKELEEARSVPVPTVKSPPSVASPAPSTSSNPFFRRTTETSFSPPIAEEQPKDNTQNAFDSIFGPSFGAAAAPAPAVSFSSSSPPPDSTITQPNETAESTPYREPEEAPSPPQSRQLTSAALPFRRQLEREDSVSSSVKVAPPTSRLSPAETPRALTPTTSTSSPSGIPESHDDPFTAAAPDAEQESVRQTLPQPSSSDSAENAFGKPSSGLVGIPGAFPSTSRSDTPAEGVSSHDATPGAGLAAAALGTGAAVTTAAAVAASGSGDDTAAAEANKGDAPKSPEQGFDDYFGGPAHARTASQKAADFDSAFANMQQPPAANGAVDSAGKEFPDIEELGQDDDSSDYSDETPMKFEDDFTAKSPPKDAASSGDIKAGKQPEIAQGEDALRPPLQGAASTSSSLPSPDQQKSPPTYGDVVPHDDPSHFPPEFKGLLPERQDPTLSPPTEGGASNPGPLPSGEPPAYGPEAHPRSPSDLKASAPPPTVAAPFDFDSAFSGVGAAPVEDDNDEDEDAGSFIASKTAADFDPTFDSPPQSRSSALPQTSTYDSVTTNGASQGGMHNFSLSNGSSGGPETGRNAGGSHDWDALFAPLNTNTAFPSTEPAGQEPALPAEQPAEATPVSPAAPAPASLAAPMSKPERPQPGRALSTGTEHDDPILKRLTAMGWSREESLAALEKFDYNIDKAADFLTFRS